jgi:hypothetical protein
MSKKIRFTLEQAKAISSGMNQQRMEKIQNKTFVDSHSIDDSIHYKEDFIIYNTSNENNEIIDQEIS